MIQPTAGQIILDGAAVAFDNSTDARNRGISIIHQELSLAPNLSVRDNIFMGREIMGPGGVDFAEEERQTRKLMEGLEEDIDPLTPVEELRLGQQQIVEIARALSVDSRILIMDEPTSALSATEVEVLFKVIRDLKSKGVSIVYISHHLEEALQITDHAVVLRDGTMTAYAPRAEIDLEWIVRNMVGENYDLGSPPGGYGFGNVALSLRDVTVPDPKGADFNVVDRISLDVRAGEVVCIYGLMGAGRTELLETVAGRLRASGGEVVLEGLEISHLTIAERIARGLALVPEDRQRDGLVQTMSVGQNLSLASIAAFTKGLFTQKKAEQALIEDSIRKVTVKTSGGGRPSDRCRGQSAEGGDRQDAGHQPPCHHAGRTLTRDRHRRQGRSVQAAGRPGKAGACRDLFHIRSGRMSVDRPSDHRHAQGPHLGRIRFHRQQGKDHGRLWRVRGGLSDKIRSHPMSDTTISRAATPKASFSLGRLLLEGRAFFALIAIIAVFSFLSPNYFTVGNFLIMASHVAIYGILAIGMLLVILNGGIDLSVGSILALSGVMAGAMMQGIELQALGSSFIRRSGRLWC